MQVHEARPTRPTTNLAVASRQDASWTISNRTWPPELSAHWTSNYSLCQAVARHLALGLAFAQVLEVVLTDKGVTESIAFLLTGLAAFGAHDAGTNDE